jgi:chromosome segregation ATPase
MPKVTDTYERAYQACVQLAVEGIPPTVKTVAEAIGTNSPAIISPAIKDWKRAVAVESLRRLELPEVPPAVADAATALWRLAMEQAQASVAGQRQTLDSERAELNTRAQQAEQEAARLREQVDHLHSETERLNQALQQAVSALAQTREAYAALEAALAAARQSAQRQQAEWEERTDRAHAWHLARISEERERAKADAAGDIARKEEALSFAQHHAALLEQQARQLTDANSALRQELDSTRQAVQYLREEERQAQRDSDTPRRLRIKRGKLRR